MLNIITVSFDGQNETITKKRYQYDKGQVCVFDDIELPEAYKVIFSNDLTGENSIPMIGDENGVKVPDDFFLTGLTIYGWVYLSEGDEDGQTVKHFTIPIEKRVRETDEEPTPEEQTEIEQLIVALNGAVNTAETAAENAGNSARQAETAAEHYPIIDDGYWYVWDVDDGEYVSTGIKALGEDGTSPTVTVTAITGGHRVTITDVDGDHVFNVMDGTDGNGIQSIAKTSTAGNVDTYTITYTNGQTTTFTVTNGITPTVDDELSDQSENPVQNKVITAKVGDLKAEISHSASIEDSTKTGVDLDVSDEDGNVLMRITNGEVETKNFNSKASALVLTGSGIADLDVADPEGNVVLRVKNGHIMTAKFTSEDILARTTYITVKKDGSGDYSTLRGAIDYINGKGDADPIEHPYVIQIYPGTYNLTDEYTQAEIETADVSDYHNGFVGWMLNDGMSLVGVGSRENIILSCVLDTSVYNQRIRGNVSTLNTEGTVSLENLTVIAERARYCVHDDFSYTGTGQYYRYVKNCKFIGKSLTHSPACTWGGGMSGQGENALYENCDFGTDYGHHFDASKCVTITFKNCRGRKIRLAERNRAVFHRVNIEDSDFDMISLMRPSGVTAQHIMINANGCNHAFVSCYEDDIVLTGAITKTALTSLPVGTMVSIGTGSGNAYAATADKSIADGVVVANDAYYSYVQRTGYINTRVLGMTGFSLGDYITIDGDNKLTQGGTASNAVGQITFISQDSDASDQGIGFIRLFIGGKK